MISIVYQEVKGKAEQAEANDARGVEDSTNDFH